MTIAQQDIYNTDDIRVVLFETKPPRQAGDVLILQKRKPDYLYPMDSASLTPEDIFEIAAMLTFHGFRPSKRETIDQLNATIGD